MSRLIGLMVLIASTSIAAQSPPPASFAKDREARRQAQTSGNAQGWARYTTDDFLYIDPTGATTTKAEFIADFASHVRPTQDRAEERFQVYADTIIITSLLPTAGVMTRGVEVWVHQGGVWRVAVVSRTRVQ
jgi:hypothetical protein